MGDFDDINVKINVDASGAEQGITRVSTSLNKLNSDVDKLGSGADFGDKLNSESKQAEGGLDKLGEAAEQANQKLAKVGSGLNLSAVGSQLDALSGKMQAWGAGLSILAAPFELVGAASVNAFADFEAGMGKIFTLLPDITDQAMSEMSSQIKEFSTTFGADLSTIQQAAYDALSSGVSQADLMPFLETAQTAAVAGMSDVGTAVDGLTSAINAYQMELDDAGRVSDVFFKTVELGKIEFDELSRNIGKVAPTAAQFGISIEDTGAAIAAMTSQGVSAEETMTGLKNLFKDVATPGTQLNKIFQEIAGVTFKDFIANGGTLAEAISKLRDYSNQTGKSFFEMGSTFESANTLAMLGGGFFEKYSEMTEKVGNAAGSTESAYSKMSDTMAFALDKLKAQFQVMSVDIGEKLAPVVLEFTQWLTENADQISDFAQNVASAAVPAIESIFNTLQKGMDMYENMSPETKAMLAKLIGVGAVGAAVAGPGLLIGGTALSPVATLITAMGTLQTKSLLAKAAMGGVGTEAGIIAGSSGAAASGLGGISTALSGIGPLGWAAAAALAAAGAAYVTNFGGFRDNINDAVKEAESAIKNFNTGNYEQAGTDAAEAMAKGLGSVGDLAVDAVKATPEALQAGEEFVSAFQDGVNQSADAFGNASAQLLLSAMKSGIESGAGVLSGAGTVISDSIQNGINIDSIGSFLVSQLSGISLESVGNTLAESLISGFTHANFGIMGDVVENALKGGAKGAIDWIQEETSKLTGKTKEEVQEAASTLPIIGGILGGDYGTKETTTPYNQVSMDTSKWSYPTQSQTTEATAAGVTTGFTDAAPIIAEQTGKSVAESLAKERGWNYKGSPDVAMAERFLDENPEFAEKYQAELKAADEETTDETKKSGDKIVKTLEELKIEAYNKAQESFVDPTTDTKYQFNKDTGQYEKYTMAEKLAEEKAKADQKAIEAQQKASDDAIEARKKAEETYNQKLIDLAAKRDEKLGDLDLSDKKYADKRAKVLDDYSDGVAEAKRKYDEAQGKYNDAIKESGNTTIDASKTTKDFKKSTQEASTGLISFSDPVKLATGEVLFFGPAVSSATSTLKELGSLDIKSIIQGWLGEGELGEAQQRKANDLGALYGEDVSDRLTNGLATTISKELPKWLEWQKEGKDQSYDDVSKYKSDLWYEFANAVLKTNYAGYTDPGTRDWTFRHNVDDKLNPDTQKITDGLFNKALESYVKPFFNGLLKSEPGKDWLGNPDVQNSSKYYSNDWKFVNEAIDQTGTESKTTTPQINTLNSAFEKIGLTGSGLTDVLSNVNQALSDHHANIQESQDYLKQYNDAAGENVKFTKDQEGQTKDLMNSIGMLGTAQNMYNTYMQDGVLDATESAHVQEALAAATKMMGDAGIDANTNLSGLPGALQALASAAQAAMSQIQSAISNANTAVQNAQSTAANIFKFGAPYTPGAMPESNLKFGNRITADNIMDPCSFGQNGQIFNDWLYSNGQKRFFASGGPVTENGPAMLHQGEYVLRRDEVNRPTSGPIQVIVNMQNSRFGDADMAKKLPNDIAAATKRALGRKGVGI